MSSGTIRRSIRKAFAVSRKACVSSTKSPRVRRLHRRQGYSRPPETSATKYLKPRQGGAFFWSFGGLSGKLDATERRPRPGFGRTPHPVDRGSLSARSGHPALTHAQNIHVLLPAIPGRQGTAHCDWCCDASIARFFEAAPVTGPWSSRGGDCGEQRMDALRRRVSHGWLTEPRSNPRPGTAPRRRPEPNLFNPLRTLFESNTNLEPCP